MKNLALFGFSLIVALQTTQAQEVQTRTVTPVDYQKIAYPNLAGNTTSSQAHPGAVTLKNGSIVKGKITFFKKKGEFERVKVNTGEEKKEILAADISAIQLDPLVFEKKYPNNYKKPERNFQSGYIVLPTGEQVNGKVAQIRDFTDYDFFVYSILFLPEGNDVASSFQGGVLKEFSQQINGVSTVWDGYADGYLLRLADGHFRLSRNPYSKTKNEFFTAVQSHVADSLSKKAAVSALTNSLKSGKDLNTSIENASNAGSMVSEVLGSVEINKKEYLIFDTQANTSVAVNKDNFKEHAQKLVAGCNLSMTREQMNWDNMEGFVAALNAGCK